MIKGSTKIELKNVKTGEVKTIVSDNIVTNAVNGLFFGNPFNPKIDVNYKFSNTKTPDSYKFFGGLLLFENALTEDANNIMPAAENKMIGNALAGFSSAEDVRELGYFDANNSTYEIKEDGSIIQKLAFEFGTGHANGQISCVCLGSYAAGYIGFGNYSGTSTKSTVDSFELNKSFFDERIFFGLYSSYAKNDVKILFDKDGKKIDSKRFVFANFKNNYLCWVVGNNYYYEEEHKEEHFRITKNLKILKSYMPLSKLNPLNFSSQNIVYSEKNIKIPDEIVFKNRQEQIKKNVICTTSDNVFLIMYDGTQYWDLGKNEEIHILKLNSDLELEKYYKIVNNTQEKISLARDNEPFSNHLIIHDNFLYINGYEGKKTFRIQLDDSTNVEELKFYNEENVKGNCEFYNLSGRLYMLLNKQQWYILVQNHCYPINGHFGYEGLPMLGTNEFFLQRTGDSQNNYYRYENVNIRKNPFFLSTINNLNEAVEKTSDMVMKIVYTLKYTPEGS